VEAAFDDVVTDTGPESGALGIDPEYNDDVTATVPMPAAGVDVEGAATPKPLVSIVGRWPEMSDREIAV
jgi:hypothetical protein